MNIYVLSSSSYPYDYHVVLIAWIPLSLFHHPTQLLITLGRSCRWHPVSAQTWWKQIFSDRPIRVFPCVGVHNNYKFVSVSQAVASISCICLSLMVCEMEGKYLYNSSFAGCFFKDLFITAFSPSSFFFKHFAKVQTILLTQIQLETISISVYQSDYMSIWRTTCWDLSMPFFMLILTSFSIGELGASDYGVMAKVLDCGLRVSEFELYSR